MDRTTAAPFSDVATHQEYRIEHSHDGTTWIHPSPSGEIGRNLDSALERFQNAVTSAADGVKHRLMHRTVSILATGWVER